MPLAVVPAARARDEHLAAADRRHRREGAQDEAVVRLDRGVAVEPHDRRGLRAGGDLAALQRSHAREVVRRAVMQTHLVAGAQGPAAGHDLHPGVEAPADAAGRLRRDQPAAALHGIAVEAAQVDAHAAAGAHDLGLVIVHLHAAHDRSRAPGLHHQRVAGADLAAPQRARDHRADALEREHAVDRQARGTSTPARLDVPGGALQGGQQFGRAAAVASAHRDDLAAGVRRAARGTRARRPPPSRATRRPRGRPWSAPPRRAARRAAR